uniref:Uncharacterized protein n=1 Tax=Ditylenchus dipsaci TaxID=166011 RepID=A0A915E4R3_9BILA
MHNHPSTCCAGDQTLATADTNKGFFACIKSTAKCPVVRAIAIIGVSAAIAFCYYRYRKDAANAAEPEPKTANETSGSSSSDASSTS